MSNTPTEIDDNDFVLKHRVAGAAFLLFFGALVLPWLLGPPSNANETADDIDSGIIQTQEYVPQDLEEEILAQLKEEVVDDEIVYISKVTPAGFTKVSETKKSQEAKKEAEKKAAQEQAKLDEANEKAKKLAAEKADAQKKAVLAKAQEEKKKTAATFTEEERTQIAAKELADALEAESQSSSEKLTSGWIVQVGVFTDRAGAEKTSKSLSDHGFTPSSTVVDTNRGVGTGTRVWLGPFDSRSDASKVKVRLADKTGSSGFVRSYP